MAYYKIFLLFLPFVSMNMQILHYNETFNDTLINKDGSFEKPFNNIEEIFKLPEIYDGSYQIQVHSNILCNNTYLNRGNKIFM